MKMVKILTLCLVTSFFVANIVEVTKADSQSPIIVEDKVIEEQEDQNIEEEVSEEERILALVKPSPVIGTISRDVKIYNHYDLKKEIGFVKQGTEVEVKKDRGYQFYYIVDYGSGTMGWISADAINIPDDPSTNLDRMSKKDVEAYADLKGYTSKTQYFVWVDIDRQLTHVFKGTKEDWTLVKTFVCSTGKNISPTTRGQYQIQNRGKSFYSERLQGGAKYWVKFNGSYLFHSISMDEDFNVQDPTLNKRASAGCVRLAVEDSEWFYNSIPTGTTVFIN